MFKLLKKQKGLTLIEVIVSLLLITIVLTAFISVFINANGQITRAENDFTALQLAEKALIEGKCGQETVDINDQEYVIKVIQKMVEEKAILKVTVSTGKEGDEPLEELYGISQLEGEGSRCE
ncbi:prepilin-type N-terminal cleavage/methylation domain-containing protein [Cytobacillus sp. FSL R5-0569]|uniref:type IV pilus modification PilV family protein n=1 Tax=Cytobacillus TaxID=2675230 RepID=UPI0027D91BF1|nr:prepilin-type N-terminal cleavage/methylation domain-containing protein [Cytobacillus kochii]